MKMKSRLLIIFGCMFLLVGALGIDAKSCASTNFGLNFVRELKKEDINQK